MSQIQAGIKKALADGVPPEQIASYLANDPEVGQGILAARADGVPDVEIIRYLASPERAQGAAMPTLARGAATFMQGPTFGFFDEIAGAVTAPVRALKEGIPLGEAYTKGRDVVRGATGSFMEQNPITGTALQVGGGLLTPGGALKAGTSLLRGGRGATAAAPVAQITSRPRQVAQATGAGAGYGFLGGVGGSEADTVSGMLSDAATSAAFGAGTSGGAQVLGATASPILRQATTRLSPRAAGSYAQQKVAEALLRDVPQNLDRSALTRAQARLATLGPEARMVDVGGRSTQRLLDVTATIPGRTAQATEQAIRQRQAGRAGRLESVADTSLGTQGADVGTLIENLNTTRSDLARPFYQQVDNVPVVVDQSLQTLLNKSKNLHASAENKFRIETGQDLDLSALRAGDTIPFKVFDLLKQSVDDATSAAKRAGQGNDSRLYGNLAKDLVNKLDDVSPKNEAGKSIYGIARDMWAGPSKLADAAELGAKSMREDVSTLNTAMRGMSESEIEAFRVGALQALRDQVGTTGGQTRLMNMWREPKTQKQLRAIFGNDFRAFSAAIARESRLRPMEAAGRGSQTAARQAGMADLDVSPLTTAVGVAGSAGMNVPGASLIQSLAPLVGRVSTPEPVRDEIGRILLSRDQQELLNLSNTIRAINEARRRQAQAAGRVGGVAGMQSAQ
jgi:hypothetical protein